MLDRIRRWTGIAGLRTRWADRVGQLRLHHSRDDAGIAYIALDDDPDDTVWIELTGHAPLHLRDDTGRVLAVSETRRPRWRGDAEPGSIERSADQRRWTIWQTARTGTRLRTAAAVDIASDGGTLTIADHHGPLPDRNAQLAGALSGAVRAAGPLLISLLITFLARDLAGGDHATIKALVGALPLVGALMLVLGVLQLWLQPDGEPRGGPLTVCAVAALGLGAIAIAPSLGMLAVGLAIMGLPTALNERLRHRYLAGAEDQDRFLEISRPWDLYTRFAMVLLVGGANVAAELAGGTGWRSAALTGAAALLAVGALASALLRVPPAQPEGSDGSADEDLLFKHSVQRSVLLNLACACSLGLVMPNIQPVLEAGFDAASSVVAALTLTSTQLIGTLLIGRESRRHRDSARRGAIQTAPWLIAAAPLAYLTLTASQAWAALASAVILMALTEYGIGASGHFSRKKLAGDGVLASMLGALATALGLALGSLLAGAPWTQTPEGLALTLAACGLAAARCARWTLSWPDKKQQLTTSTVVVVRLRKQNGVTTLLLGDEGAPKKAFKVVGVTKLSAAKQRRRFAEPVITTLIGLQVGTPSRLFAALAARAPAKGRLHPYVSRLRAVADGCFASVECRVAHGVAYSYTARAEEQQIKLRFPKPIDLEWRIPRRWADDREGPTVDA